MLPLQLFQSWVVSKANLPHFTERKTEGNYPDPLINCTFLLDTTYDL